MAIRLLGKAIVAGGTEVLLKEAAPIAASANFAAAGLSAIARPMRADGSALNPVLPMDLTVLDDVQLARLYSEFSLMAQYVKLQLARMVVEHSEDRRQEKMIRALVRLEKSGQVGDKDAKCEVDPKTRDSAYRTQVSYGTQVLTEAMMEAYLIGRDACSREQTRRQKIWEDRRT
jgi:hypothetical protein